MTNSSKVTLENNSHNQVQRTRLLSPGPRKLREAALQLCTSSTHLLEELFQHESNKEALQVLWNSRSDWVPGDKEAFHCEPEMIAQQFVRKFIIEHIGEYTAGKDELAIGKLPFNVPSGPKVKVVVRLPNNSEYVSCREHLSLVGYAGTADYQSAIAAFIPQLEALCDRHNRVTSSPAYVNLLSPKAEVRSKERKDLARCVGSLLQIRSILDVYSSTRSNNTVSRHHASNGSMLSECIRSALIEEHNKDIVEAIKESTEALEDYFFGFDFAYSLTEFLKAYTLCSHRGSVWQSFVARKSGWNLDRAESSPFSREDFSKPFATVVFELLQNVLRIVDMENCSQKFHEELEVVNDFLDKQPEGVGAKFYVHTRSQATIRRLFGQLEDIPPEKRTILGSLVTASASASLFALKHLGNFEGPFSTQSLFMEVWSHNPHFVKNLTTKVSSRPFLVGFDNAERLSFRSMVKAHHSTPVGNQAARKASISKLRDFYLKASFRNRYWFGPFRVAIAISLIQQFRDSSDKSIPELAVAALQDLATAFLIEITVINYSAFNGPLQSCVEQSKRSLRSGVAKALSASGNVSEALTMGLFRGLSVLGFVSACLQAHQHYKTPTSFNHGAIIPAIRVVIAGGYMTTALFFVKRRLLLMFWAGAGLVVDYYAFLEGVHSWFHGNTTEDTLEALCKHLRENDYFKKVKQAELSDRLIERVRYITDGEVPSDSPLTIGGTGSRSALSLLEKILFDWRLEWSDPKPKEMKAYYRGGVAPALLSRLFEKDKEDVEAQVKSWNEESHAEDNGETPCRLIQLYPPSNAAFSEGELVYIRLLLEHTYATCVAELVLENDSSTTPREVRLSHFAEFSESRNGEIFQEMFTGTFRFEDIDDYRFTPIPVFREGVDLVNVDKNGIKNALARETIQIEWNDSP
jgi:hypothetical protein